jgi:hypothetical protein
VYEHHYDHQQIGGPLTPDDLNLDSGRWAEFRSL